MPRLELAPVSVVNVCDAGKSDVYNLTIDGQPEYFANGLLVHNCADALRYLLINLGSGPEFTIFDDLPDPAAPRLAPGMAIVPRAGDPTWDVPDDDDGPARGATVVSPFQ